MFVWGRIAALIVVVTTERLGEHVCSLNSFRIVVFYKKSRESMEHDGNIAALVSLLSVCQAFYLLSVRYYSSALLHMRHMRYAS